jgi:glycopeptide antibiotics resistance protein
VTRSPLTYPLLGTIAYMLVVVVILIVPAAAPHARSGYLTEYQLPIGRRFIGDVIVNIAMFVPIGWGLHRVARHLGAPTRPLALAVALVAAAFSVLMETAQFWLPARYSSIVDVVANTLGATLGAFSEHRYGRRQRRARGSYGSHPG